MPELTIADLKVGRIFRAKKPRAADVTLGNRDGLYNDRVIKWIGLGEVQYDGPSVADGRHYPRVSHEAFLKWAGRDVTDIMPPGEWARYGS